MPTKIYDVDPTKTYRVPHGKCYACDQKVIGAALHRGAVQGACKRHIYHDMKAEVRAPECYVCGGSVGRNQGQCETHRDGTKTYIHIKCLRKECET